PAEGECPPGKRNSHRLQNYRRRQRTPLDEEQPELSLRHRSCEPCHSISWAFNVVFAAKRQQQVPTTPSSSSSGVAFLADKRGPPHALLARHVHCCSDNPPPPPPLSVSSVHCLCCRSVCLSALFAP
ncbi:unnamed protein product, partial [Ectocarpus sp. 8 AP-2014]